MKIDFRIVITAMICLTILEIVALLKGANGHLLQLVLFMIGGLAGWMGLPQPQKGNFQKNHKNIKHLQTSPS